MGFDFRENNCLSLKVHSHEPVLFAVLCLPSTATELGERSNERRST